MFKIGDKVKIIDLFKNRKTGRIKKGMIGTVTRVCTETYTSRDYVHLDIEGEDYDGGFWFSEIKKISKEPRVFEIAKWCKKYYERKIE